MTDHPLQASLQRASQALHTATDLIEIANSRKSYKSRSDARQASLYRAIVASSVAAIEESCESLAWNYLKSTGISVGALPGLKQTISRVFQTPNSNEIYKLFTEFCDFDPRSSLKVRLRTSEPSFRAERATSRGPERKIYTIYNKVFTWDQNNAASVLDRFVRIRHSFAHQDTSSGILTRGERGTVRTRLIQGKASSVDDIEFVRLVNSTAAVHVLVDPTLSGGEVIHRWTLHETHALNALLCAAGVIGSITGGLADHMGSLGIATRNNFDPLHLDLDRGEWITLLDGTSGPRPLSQANFGVEWRHVEYRPGSRVQ